MRQAAERMRLARMGASFPTRLSFMRVLLRALAAQRAAVHRPLWQISPDGYGRAIYSLHIGAEVYSLVAFSNPLPDAQRSDRVIASAWDTTYVLYDGTPNAAEVARLAANAPKQEAGRFHRSELVLCRANKSVRFFNHTVERLAAGKQPAEELLTSVGYLMRTTAVYGNGKFGIADRSAIAARPLLQPPFQAELLAVWLVRLFTFDLAAHIAQARAPQRAVPLAAPVKRYLGIGNATGLGMAPFLVTHPLLLHQWMHTRTRALRAALAGGAAGEGARLRTLLHRAQAHLAQWHAADAAQQQRTHTLQAELAALLESSAAWIDTAQARRKLHRQAQANSLDCQELIAALLLEMTPAANALAPQLSTDKRIRLQPAMRVGELRDLIEKNFAWAVELEYAQPQHSQRFWYVSEEKAEPRLGERRAQPGSEKELPLDIARRVRALADALADAAPAQRVGEFLLARPHLRLAVRRVQAQAAHPCAEIQENLIGAGLRPVDMLRFKLSFFGACKFDPKSDLWTRIALFQGAPLPHELQQPDADDWWLPVYRSEEDAPLRQ